MMELIERMTTSTEGIMYLAMMALSAFPLVIGIYGIFKRVSFWSSFFLWVGIFHCIWFSGVLLLIYESTPPGTPSMLAILWIIFLSFLTYLVTKKQNVTNNGKFYKKLWAFVIGSFSAFLTFSVVFLITLSIFIFADSYHIKTGEKAWLSEQEVRAAIGISSMPIFEYDKALSRTGGNHEWTEQNHWAKYTKKPSSAFYNLIEKKCKNHNSGLDEITYENGTKEFRYHGMAQKEGEDYSIYVTIPKDEDSLRICILR